MAGASYQRVFGLETEFGCLVLDDSLGSVEAVVEAIKDTAFLRLKVGVLDLHSRDEVFEPARSGGFLLNGGRFYIDAVGSHLEYATAECTTLKEVLANDRAGHRLIQQSIQELGLEGKVKVYNNSVDHFGGHTFGCHENYLVHMEEDFFSHKVNFLIPFLVTRQIFAGVGRVGGHVLREVGEAPDLEQIRRNPVDYIWVSQIYGVESDPTVDFQLSQRSDHIIKTTASRVRFNRALINPKWEHFYSHNQLQRLHLLFGESNQMEYAYMLKVGTTRLAIRLVEDNLLDESILLASPLIAMRTISRDPTYEWRVLDAFGNETSALEVQRHYLRLAERYRGSDADTDWTLEEWTRTLDALEEDPYQLDDRLDWVAKRKLIEEVRAEENLGWDDDFLHSVDLEYHSINPEESLFHALQEMGNTKRMLDDLDIIDAMTEPPKTTRALPRSELIKQILERRSLGVYAVDWSGVALGRSQYVDLSDPLCTEMPPMTAP